MSDKITDYLTESQILLQLAEEAAELSAAAAKMARKLDGANPTPKSVEECRAALVEEYVDVQLCSDQIDSSWFDGCDEVYRSKKERWLKRLQGKDGKNE